jgi:Rieske 2Fe-2S family protein
MAFERKQRSAECFAEGNSMPDFSTETYVTPEFARVREWVRSRRPGHALPQPLYTTPEAFAFDLRTIFGRAWVLAGLACELAGPGAAMALTVGTSPIVILRDRDGEIRAFHNSCRHRGAMVCPPGLSQRQLLVCPYHQWSYDLAGKLVIARRMQESFDPAEHSLKPVHVRDIAGCLYVSLADDPPPIEEYAQGLAPLLAPHDLPNARLAHTETFIEKANWKLVMENARECYHCAARHPDLALTFPTEVKAHFAADTAGKVARFEARMEAAGLPVGPTIGDWWQAIRFPLNDGVFSMTMDGKHAVRRLMVDKEGGDIGSVRWATEPNAFSHALADHTFVFMAEPRGPQETLVTGKWFVHRDAVEGVDYHVESLVALWLNTNKQDIELVENNQCGVNGIGYEPGPYSEEAEALVRRFTNWYCQEAMRALA